MRTTETIRRQDKSVFRQQSPNVPAQFRIIRSSALYANMFIAAAFAFCARLVSEGPPVTNRLATTCGFLTLEVIFFAGSRDTLQKYYSRTQQLLNSHHP